MTDWHWSRVGQRLASVLTRRSVRPKRAEAAADHPSESPEQPRASRLIPGDRVSRYEILDLLGAGGMGEIYRARDTRLDRVVVLKVLPVETAVDPDWSARLEREARAVSRLNHPHVCALYDVGQHENIDFLVMEYLEGETVAERLRRGALPIDDVLTFGREIADALEAAHKHGIVHRDLKPANIMLTAAGAKLLDFGIAKPLTDTSAAPAPVDPRLTAQLFGPRGVRRYADRSKSHGSRQAREQAPSDLRWTRRSSRGAPDRGQSKRLARSTGAGRCDSATPG
jgi:serine/threonine protein kinase